MVVLNSLESEDITIRSSVMNEEMFDELDTSNLASYVQQSECGYHCEAILGCIKFNI